MHSEAQVVERFSFNGEETSEKGGKRERGGIKSKREREVERLRYWFSMHLTCLDSLSFYPLPVFVCATSEGPACGTGYVKCDRTHRRHAVEFNFICSALIDCASGRKYVRTSTSTEYYILIALFFLPTIRSSAQWEPLLPTTTCYVKGHCDIDIVHRG